MKTTTLVPAFGSNRSNADRPAKLLKGCEWIGVPFAGGMSECAHFTARTIVINDTHHHLMNLAGVVGDPIYGPKLVRRLRRVPCHPWPLEVAQRACATYSRLSMGSDMETRLNFAVDYFITAWLGRSGLALTDQEFKGGLALRWNAGGGDSAVRYRSAIDSLRDWRKILARATFSVLDCFDFLDKCKDQEKHAVYCDPPWPDDGDKYTHKFTEAMQRRLADALATFETTRVVVRYGDHPLIRELYPEPQWTWHLLTGRTQTNADKAEVLLTNWRES